MEEKNLSGLEPEELDIPEDPNLSQEPETAEPAASETAEPAASETAEPEAPEVPQKKKVLNRVLYYGLLVIFVGVFVGCAIYISKYLVNSQQNTGSYNDLSDIRNQYLNGQVDPEHTLPEGVVPTLPGGDPDPDYILPELLALYQQNRDLVGWINVPGTNIDYPVVQSLNEANFYLNRGFDKEYSSWGCLYVREACNVFAPSDNVVIYGHHMRDGTMFSQLKKYRDKEFWEENQTFTFDTLYERHTYQIIAVFKTSANVGQGFAYHTFNDAQSQEDFDEFMDEVHRLQFYDTGHTAEYGDLLVTLSTCEYTLNNGRLVVVAKRIS